ncbi:addiction module antidote protein [uncultured Campylobacter sp.]|jgi:probable addiction module antidote protein|uniref:addiction module antidote protein n=1 Tax=uncultured Campylobacter sp. TaxID=218934 RepID=UPI0026259270|nr:addiction module antidote protein [uncultured Campylobacter sp.]
MELKTFELSDFLDNDDVRKEYLNQVLADGDLEELKRALLYISKSYGVEKIAKKANLNRESFYKIFKPNSKPRFETISKILRAFDMNLSVSA